MFNAPPNNRERHEGPSAAFGRHQIRKTKIEKRKNFKLQMTKNSKLQNLRKPPLINALQLCSFKNEHKKQEVDG